MILSIVILSYNTPDLVLDCINSLQKNYEEELKNKNVEIIIVDNASEKNAAEDLGKGLKDLTGVSLIMSKENLGFGRGCNLGEENSNGGAVLFLNSDTQVTDKGLLEMADFLKENPKTAVIGGKLVNLDKSPQASAGKFYNLLNFFIMLVGGERLGFLKFTPSKIAEVDWVTGACFMVNKKIFNTLGRFDENIFMYMEDMEFCYRAKRRGYKTYFFPDAVVKHMEQGSSNRAFAVLGIYKGILYFYKKHKNELQYQIVRFSLWLKAVTVYFLGRLTNNSYYTTTYGQALRVFKK